MIIFIYFIGCCLGWVFIGSLGERIGEVSLGYYGC